MSATGLRVLVCGGRHYADIDRVTNTLDCLHNQQVGVKIDVVIHGAAPGADTLAGLWAESRGVATSKFPANWHEHGRKAGAIRNQLMLDVGMPSLVVAFPGGTGTADMVRRAKRAGISVVEIEQAQ